MNNCAGNNPTVDGSRNNDNPVPDVDLDADPDADPEDAASSGSPDGFSLCTNVVSEEAWEEIRTYLGLTTIPCRFDPTGDTNTTCDDIDGDGAVRPSIRIHGFSGGNMECDNHNRNYNHETDVVDSSVTAISATPTMTKTKIPWESTPSPQNRPVAQFGFRYDYEKDMVAPPTTTNTDDDVGVAVPKIPDVFRHLLLQRHRNRADFNVESSKEFKQCIVNVYRPTVQFATIDDDSNSSEPGTTAISPCCSSIPWHVDDPDFGPDILVYTFGETRPLHMRLKRHEDNNNNAFNETKDRNDDSSSYTYFTAYPSHRSCYVLSGQARYDWQHSVPSGSGWRVSITFRTLRSL